MNMLYEGLKQNSTLVIVPSTALESMQLGGLAGITALTMGVGHDGNGKDKDAVVAGVGERRHSRFVTGADCDRSHALKATQAPRSQAGDLRPCLRVITQSAREAMIYARWRLGVPFGLSGMDHVRPLIES